jgi:hypothetical protein
MQHLEGSGTPVLYIGRTVLKGYLYEAQHVSGETPSIIRSLKLHWQPLVLHTWKVGGRCQEQYCLTTSTIYTYKQPSTYKKPEAASAVLGS